MSIPKRITDELASLEAQLKRIQDRIDIYYFVISAYEGERGEPTEPTSPSYRGSRPARPAHPGFDYGPLIEAIKSGGPAGVPISLLHYDHPSRLTVLQKKKQAKKLPNGNWAILEGAST